MCYHVLGEGRSQAGGNVQTPYQNIGEMHEPHARLPKVWYEIPKRWPHTGFVQRGLIRRPRAVSTLNSLCVKQGE
jgi:hypothetical protein